MPRGKEPTEERKTGTASRRGAAVLRGLSTALLDGIPDAVWAKDLRGVYVALNEAAARLLDRPATEVLGKDDTALLSAEDARRATADDREILASGVPRTFEEALSPGGTHHTFLTTKAPVRDGRGTVVGLLGIRRDITAGKRDEAALLESEDLFRCVFDNAVIGISVTRPDGRIQVNPALAEMLGYTPAELQQANWRDVTHPDDVEMTQRQVTDLVAGTRRSTRFEKRFLRRNGSVVWADLSSAVRHDAEGRPVYLVTAISDITERKRAQAALEERTRQLEALNEELGRLSREDALTGLANRRSFNDRLDHEWRRARRTASPLALILVDVDHFKEFNDAHGHLEGDACLRRIGGYLSLAFGRANDLPARLGGDEFCILLADTPLEGAVVAAEKLRSAFESFAIPLRLSGSPAIVTLSIGAAAGIPGPDQTADALLHAADQALYHVKERGRNGVSSRALAPQPTPAG